MMLSKKEMAAKVSILYYEKNKSQNEIAKELGISRSYVSQLITYAKEIGLVTISINIDEYNLRIIKKEIDFKCKFPNLKQVYIMSSETDEFTQDNIGKFAAPYVTDLINQSEVVGINLGISVEKTIGELESERFFNSNNKKVVQIMGGFSNSNVISGAHPNELVNKLGEVLNCESYFLNCPAFVEQTTLRRDLLNEKTIKNVVDMWDEIDLTIMGIGIMDKRSKLYNLFNGNMLKEIKDNDVSCELNINFFKKNGDYVPLMDDNKISISYEILKKIKKKVVICYGAHKSEAILSALKGNMIDVLITDSITINAIEKYMEEE